MPTSDSLNTVRIDHIGSLVRPQKLREVFGRYDRGEATREELVRRGIEPIIPARKIIVGLLIRRVVNYVDTSVVGLLNEQMPGYKTSVVESFAMNIRSRILKPSCTWLVPISA